MTANISLEPCVHCRLPTPAPLLLPHTKSFHRGHAKICLNCCADAGRCEDFYLASAFLVAILLLPISRLFSSLPPPMASILSIAFSVSLFLVTIIPLHEFAHYFTALALGYHVPMLTFGAGDPLFTMKIRSLRIVVGSWIGSGVCWPVFPAGLAPRWKRVLLSAAGPLSNFVMAIIALVLAAWALFDPSPHPTLITCCAIFAAGNFVYFLGSAIPGQRHRGGNDAAHILDHLRNSAAHQMQLLGGNHWIQIEMNLLKGDRQTARQQLLTARQAIPDYLPLLFQDLSLYAATGDWPAIQNIARPRLATQLRAEVLWWIAPMLILANLHTRTPADLAEAQRLSQRLQESVPRLPLAMTVRSFILCADSDYQSAFTLLSQAARSSSNPYVQALIYHALANIHDHFQSPSQAARHRAHAAFQDPENLVSSATIPPLYTP